MTRTSKNQGANRAITRLIRGALVAATVLVAVLGVGGTEMDARGSKGEEIPSLLGDRAPTFGQAAAPALSLPIP